MGRKNIFYLFSFFALLLTSSCNKLPKGILDEDQTAAILADFKLTESGYWSNNNTTATSVQINGTATKQPEAPAAIGNPNQLAYNDYAFIAKKHKTTVEVFKKTMDYYYKNPQKLERILNKTLVIIQKNDVEHRRIK